jgi:hypothetical protein
VKGPVRKRKKSEKRMQSSKRKRRRKGSSPVKQPSQERLKQTAGIKEKRKIYQLEVL